MWTDRLRIKRGLTLMWLALAAYAAYLVNAAQFLIKFQSARESSPAPAEAGAGWLGAVE